MLVSRNLYLTDYLTKQNQKLRSRLQNLITDIVHSILSRSWGKLVVVLSNSPNSARETFDGKHLPRNKPQYRYLILIVFNIHLVGTRAVRRKTNLSRNQIPGDLANGTSCTFAFHETKILPLSSTVQSYYQRNSTSVFDNFGGSFLWEWNYGR